MTEQSNIQRPRAPVKSRKRKIANWYQWLFAGGASANMAYQIADTLKATQGFLAPFKDFAGEYGLGFLLVIMVIGLLGALAWKHFQDEDIREGRYTPSGKTQ